MDRHTSAVTGSRPRRLELVHQLALLHHAEPQQVAKADVLQAVLVPSFVVRGRKLREYHQVPAQDDTALVWVVRMRLLGKRGAAEVVGYEHGIGRIRFPSELGV